VRVAVDPRRCRRRTLPGGGALGRPAGLPLAPLGGATSALHRKGQRDARK
jgi:hypothetical protein